MTGVERIAAERRRMDADDGSCDYMGWVDVFLDRYTRCRSAGHKETILVKAGALIAAEIDRIQGKRDDAD